MKIESFHKNNKKKKSIIGFTIICIALVVGIFLYHSYAFFTDENTFNSFSGNVTPVGDLYFSVYIEDEASTSVPSSSSGYSFDHAICSNGASATWDSTNWGPIISNITTSRTKCTLYFSKPANATLAKLQNLNPSIVLNTSMNNETGTCPSYDTTSKTITVTAGEDNASLLCEAADDLGTSYYFRGNVTNNYVRFGKWQTDYYIGYVSDNDNYEAFTSLSACEAAAGSDNCTKYASAGDDMYWRIIRINGDGSIRMIYDGTQAYANIQEGGSLDYGENRQIGTRYFNEYSGDNAYVGYMYKGINQSSYADTFDVMNNKNAISSTIKGDASASGSIDYWYANSIDIMIPSSTKKYSDYVSLDTIFCNDKNISETTPSGYTTNGYGTQKTAYRWNYYPWSTTFQQQPRLTCVNTQGTVDSKNDAFSVSSTGNGALTYPVALITADEVTVAGSYFGVLNHYLKTGAPYWTMSPKDRGAAYASSTNIVETGFVGGSYYVSMNLGVRPVLSLKPDVEFSGGDGTMNNPFEIVYN